MAKSITQPRRPVRNVTASTRVLRSQTKTTSTPTLTPPPTNSRVTKTSSTTNRRKRLDPWYPKRKANPNPKPRAPPPTHFTCRICISHLPSADFIRWVPPRRQYGKPRDAPIQCIPHLARNPSRRSIDPVCKTCVGAFMAARLDTHGARQVSVGCVEPGCTTAWPWEKVIEYFPAERLEEYNLALFEHWRVDAALFECLSPSCDFVGLLDVSATGYPQVECNVCAFRSCAACRVPWHKEQTCAELSAAAVSAKMSDAERETLQLMQSKDGRRCPNCQLVIEKDGGCPSMFCPGCKKYFNWDAAASAVPGARKAVPVVTENEYWRTPENVVCEVNGSTGTVISDAMLADVELGCMLRDIDTALASMPLPDEDDPDL